jgi:hypothetical protein
MRERRLPVVVALSSVPLLSEALASVLDGIAEVQSLPARLSDSVGLLESIRPDALVVETCAELDGVAEFALASGTPLVSVSLHDERVSVFDEGRWTEAPAGAASAESIRNVVAGTLFGRRK